MHLIGIVGKVVIAATHLTYLSAAGGYNCRDMGANAECIRTCARESDTQIVVVVFGIVLIKHQVLGRVIRNEDIHIAVAFHVETG